jgi:hypothetical protein
MISMICPTLLSNSGSSCSVRSILSAFWDKSGVLLQAAINES